MRSAEQIHARLTSDASVGVVLARWGKGTWPGLWINLSGVPSEDTRRQLLKAKARNRHQKPELVHFFSGTNAAGKSDWCDKASLAQFELQAGGADAKTCENRRVRAMRQAEAYYIALQQTEDDGAVQSAGSGSAPSHGGNKIGSALSIDRTGAGIPQRTAPTSVQTAPSNPRSRKRGRLKRRRSRPNQGSFCTNPNLRVRLHGIEAIGQNVKVYNADNAKWEAGTVRAFDQDTSLHVVHFGEDDRRDLDLHQLTIEEFLQWGEWKETGFALAREPCPICFAEPMEDPAAVEVCSHVFCKECISSWVNIHSSCPLCRVAVKQAQGLFLKTRR